MAKQIKVTEIDLNTGNVTIEVTYNTLTKTFIISNLPFDNKQDFVEAVKEHLKSYIRGAKSSKLTVSSEVSSMVNKIESIDLGEE